MSPQALLKRFYAAFSTLDARTMQWSEMRLVRQPDCPVCGARGPVGAGPLPNRPRPLGGQRTQ